jgi:hypothetical protein
MVPPRLDVSAFTPKGDQETERDFRRALLSSRVSSLRASASWAASLAGFDSSLCSRS